MKPGFFESNRIFKRDMSQTKSIPLFDKNISFFHLGEEVLDELTMAIQIK